MNIFIIITLMLTTPQLDSTSRINFQGQQAEQTICSGCYILGHKVLDMSPVVDNKTAEWEDQMKKW